MKALIVLAAITGALLSGCSSYGLRSGTSGDTRDATSPINPGMDSLGATH